MARITRLMDGIVNALTGMGTTADARTRSGYHFVPLSQYDIEAAYRGSGIMRKVIDIPAFDMVREWRDWKAEDAEITALEAEEKRLDLIGKTMQAEILRGLGGAAFIMGLPGDPALPANERATGKGNLAFIHVVNRWQLQAEAWVEDPTDPLYGGPTMWTINTAGKAGQRIHPSRVVCFKADPLPMMTGTSRENQFWGESRVAKVLDAVQNSDTAQAGFAALIAKARNTRVGIPGLSDTLSTSDGEKNLQSRLAAMQLGESMFNVSIYESGKNGEAGEEIKDVQVTWTGMDSMMTAFDVRVAAVADIPMTRLFGRAAEGMNASGQSQQQDWNRHVRAKQTLSLAPCLDQVDRYFVPSALGKTPPELWWEFANLDIPDEKEEAETFKLNVEALKIVQEINAMPEAAFNKATQNTLIETGHMSGLDQALAEHSDDERYGVMQGFGEGDPSALTQGGGDPSAAGNDPSAFEPLKRAANDKKGEIDGDD